MSFLRNLISTSSPPVPTTPSTNASGAVVAQVDTFTPEWPDQLKDERYYGLENFGNTCYANSVLQALYFSKPFRELIESYPSPTVAPSPMEPGLDSNISSAFIRSTPPLPSSPVVTSSSSQSKQKPPIGRTSSRSAGAGSSITGPYRGLAGGNRSYSNGTPTSPPPPSVSLPPSSKQPLPSTSPSNTPLTSPTTLLSTLHDLFVTISSQAKSSGSVAPEAFIQQLRHDNEFFRSTLHQDAHEFLNYLINSIAEQVAKRDAEEEEKERFEVDEERKEKERDESSGRDSSRESQQHHLRDPREVAARKWERVRSTSRRRRRNMMRGKPSLLASTSITAVNSPVLNEAHATSGVHDLFEGILTNETRCLTCETITSRDEAFLDLSIDIEPNSSVTSCLRQFSASEMLCQKNKFSCDQCCGLQEAEKRMKIKKLPNILALHLKRFKYEESLQRHVKLTYRVVFPFELRLFNTASDVEDPDRLYELWAIIVHIGIGPSHGHYITIVKSGKRWVVFDDNAVVPIEESEIQNYFGDTPGQGSGYVLFYQAVDLMTHQSETMAANFNFAEPMPSSSSTQSSPSLATTTTNGLGLQFNPRSRDPSADSNISISTSSATLTTNDESAHTSFTTSFPHLSPLTHLSASLPASTTTVDSTRATGLGRRVSSGGGMGSTVVSSSAGSGGGSWGLMKGTSIGARLGRKISLSTAASRSSPNVSHISAPIPIVAPDDTSSSSEVESLLSPPPPTALSLASLLAFESTSPRSSTLNGYGIPISGTPPSPVISHPGAAEPSENGSTSTSTTNTNTSWLAARPTAPPPPPVVISRSQDDHPSSNHGNQSNSTASLGSRTLNFLGRRTSTTPTPAVPVVMVNAISSPTTTTTNSMGVRLALTEEERKAEKHARKAEEKERERREKEREKGIKEEKRRRKAEEKEEERARRN